MLVAAAGGLATEFVALYLLYRQQGQDLNVRGACWHIIQTFVGSLIIIVAALVIRFTGFLAIDPLLGIAFGFVLLWASWGILRESVHLLMEGTPPGVDLAEVAATLGELEGVRDVHHVHAWALTSGRYIFSGHLRTSTAAATVGHDLLARAHDLLRDRLGFFFVTRQIETTCLDEAAVTEIDITSSAPLA
jgi:cobalt-zinc-cadmium efflux system protein